jgi:cytochrome c heme-lyase
MTVSSEPGKCPVNSTVKGCPVQKEKENNFLLNYIPTDLVIDNTKLDSNREKSSIPMGSSEKGNWVYPSEQQFFAALKRKGYETEVEDIPMIVSIHNEMNELCWKEVEKWEKQYGSLCTPRLVKLIGRPSEPSIKARLYS